MWGRKWKAWKREADHLRQMADTFSVQALDQERILVEHEARFEAIREALLSDDATTAFVAAGGDIETWKAESP